MFFWMVWKPDLWILSDCTKITRGVCSWCFFLSLMCFSVWPVSLTGTVNEVWFEVFSHEGFHVLGNIVLKVTYKQTVLTSILHLKMVDRETALWRKQERFFCCYFLYVQNNVNYPATWTHTHKPDYLSYYVSCNDLSCNFLSLSHKHTHSYVHAHKYYSSAVIWEIFGFCFTNTENRLQSYCY